MKIRVVKTSEPAFKSLMARILQRRGSREGEVEKRVAEIVRAVQKTGDRALARYTQLFDRVRLTRSNMEGKSNEIELAMKKVPAKDLLTLRLAARRIAAFHRRQLQKSGEYCERAGLLSCARITPLER